LLCLQPDAVFSTPRSWLSSRAKAFRGQASLSALLDPPVDTGKPAIARLTISSKLTVRRKTNQSSVFQMFSAELLALFPLLWN
jgi:hypothetical protein